MVSEDFSCLFNRIDPFGWPNTPCLEWRTVTRKTPQWKFQNPKPVCSPQHRRVKCCSHYVFVLDVCAACAGRLCCSCWRFVLLVLEVRAACAGGSCSLCWRFVLLVLEVRAACAGGLRCSCLRLCWRCLRC